MVKTIEQEHISDSMHREVRRVVAKLWSEQLTPAWVVHYTCTRSIKLFIIDVGSNNGRIFKSEELWYLIDTKSFHTYWISRGRFLYPDCYLVRNLKGCLFDFSSWGLGRSGGSLLFMEESIPFPPWAIGVQSFLLRFYTCRYLPFLWIYALIRPLSEL